MREIIFRGKTYKGEWVKGDLSQHKTGKKFIKCGNATSSCEVIPETVGQYTGLTDKNGTKIFEGDIVKVKLNDNSEVNASVYFRNGYFTNSLSTYLGGLVTIVGDSTVIGNIHDNPELLKGE